VAALWNGNEYYISGTPANEYNILRNASLAIYKDYQSSEYSKYPHLLVFWKQLDVWHFDWFTGPIWFFLESITGEKLIVTNPSESNIKPVVRDPIYYYLICEDNYQTVSNQDYIDSNCIQPFIDKYSGQIEVKHQQIWKLENQAYYSLYIYRFLKNNN
jgi:hypothetical protein